MNSSDKIENLFKEANVNVESDVDNRILGDALENLQQPDAGSTSDRINVWRIIMKARITKLSSAAAVIIAAVIAIMFLNGHASVALAEVIEKVKEYNTLIQYESRVMTILGQDQPFMTTDVKKYVSTEYGAVEEQFDQRGNLITTVYLLREKQQAIVVLHPPKKYFVIDLDNTTLELQQGFNAKGYVEWIVTESETVKLGQKEIDGGKVEGFMAVNPKAMAEMAEVSNGMFPIGDNTWKLWVDIETKLPTKIEVDFVMNKGPMTNYTDVHIKAETSRIEWGAEFDESIFEPDIPDNYTKLDAPSSPK